jgi:hypothetical protein
VLIFLICALMSPTLSGPAVQEMSSWLIRTISNPPQSRPGPFLRQN